MNCRTFMDKVYDFWGEETLPFSFRLKMGMHLFFCRRCACEVKKLKDAQQIMENDFFQDPFLLFSDKSGLEISIEDRIMEEIYAQDVEWENADFSAGVSFRSWVITGFIILLSLTTSFFGMDFIKVAASHGSSFLLPVGITIGCIVTAYGAVFIGSHLEELSEKFDLH